MYNYPHGDNQQINLNWIISEIIALHQRLDPDYTAPTFTQIYPFSDTQQLNLDWILAELKTLKELAPTPPPTEEIDEIGQALIAGAYDATTSYQKNDYIVQDGKLYRANAATTGTFDPTKWNEVMLGDDLAIITRWADVTNTYLNSLAASNIANDSSVTGPTVKDVLDSLNDRIHRGDVDISVLTDSWLLTAKDGVYKVTGTSRTGTFIEDADNNFGLLTIATAPHSSADYGYIIFHSTTGRTFYRDFTKGVNTLSWRTVLQEIATNQDISNLNGAINHVIFVVKGNLQSDVTAFGQIFSASDSRINADTTVANVIYDSPLAVTSSSVVATTGNGTVTLSGTTSNFSGTVTVVIELYN